jgi:hypothetical protein
MELKFYENGIEKAKSTYILFENILISINILAGFVGMYSIQIFKIPILSVLYVIFILTMLIFLLRKHLCTQCYYYDKNCHCGWGKLSAKLYKKNSGNQKLGGLLAGLTWGTLMGVPIIAIIILLVLNFSLIALICLIVCVITTTINSILHVKDCKECKMRYICPGSSFKKTGKQ